MKRNVLLLLVAGLLSTGALEGKGRGHFGHRGSGLSAHRVPGAFFHGHHGHGHSGFGVGNRGFGLRQFRLFSSPGFFSSGIYLTYQGQEYAVAPPAETPAYPTLYYQKVPKSGVKTDCRDRWTQKSSPSSLSHFINQLFELQCQNNQSNGQSGTWQNSKSSLAEVEVP
jgi:hypothetical protein